MTTSITTPDSSHYDAASGPAFGAGRNEWVDKPWGGEEIFAAQEGAFVGKVLHIMGSRSLSLQVHRHKHETLSVQHGRIAVEIGPDRSALQTVSLGVGEWIHVPAGTVHRITAVEHSTVVEVSTAFPGWRTDVERLEDDYGREATTAP